MKLTVKWTLNALKRNVKTARKDWLYKAGAYLRKVARSSVKRGKVKDEWIVNEFGVRQHVKRKIHSAPGEPPRDFHGWRRTFHFDVDNAAEVVVVGAVGGRKGIPPIHEYGGSSVAEWRVIDRSGKWHTRKASRHLSPRPTMQPAYEKGKAVISNFWLNAVK